MSRFVEFCSATPISLCRLHHLPESPARPTLPPKLLNYYPLLYRQNQLWSCSVAFRAPPPSFPNDVQYSTTSAAIPMQIAIAQTLPRSFCAYSMRAGPIRKKMLHTYIKILVNFNFCNPLVGNYEGRQETIRRKKIKSPGQKA